MPSSYRYRLCRTGHIFSWNRASFRSRLSDIVPLNLSLLEEYALKRDEIVCDRVEVWLSDGASLWGHLSNMMQRALAGWAVQSVLRLAVQMLAHLWLLVLRHLLQGSLHLAKGWPLEQPEIRI